MKSNKEIKGKILIFVNEQNWNKLLDCQDLPNKVIIEKAIDMTIQETTNHYNQKIKERIKELEKINENLKHLKGIDLPIPEIMGNGKSELIEDYNENVRVIGELKSLLENKKE